MDKHISGLTWVKTAPDGTSTNICSQEAQHIDLHPTEGSPSAGWVSGASKHRHT